MNMPIFAPSLRLLVSWVRKHHILWERQYGEPERLPHSHLPDEPTLSPYSSDIDSLVHWLNFSDFYVFPHVQV